MIRSTKVVLAFTAFAALAPTALAGNPDPMFSSILTAAQAGNPAAENTLAYMILVGSAPGHLPDPELAMRWYEKAAAQGLPQAQNSLGSMWEQGAAGPTNYVEAAKWYQQAADQDFAPAQLAIARLYEEGKGLPQSDDNALLWYRKAAEHGLQEGKDRADAIENRRILVAEAEKAAAEQRQRADAQNSKLTMAFRKSVKKGTDSHCGMVVSIDGPIVQVQGPAPIGQFALRINQLYPPGVAPCNFFNGRYQNPGLPY